MHTGKGRVVEMILDNGFHHARLTCAENLIPSPGQYLLVSDDSRLPLPVPIFYTDSALGGFIAAAPIPDSWSPGREIYLRGPLGRGFKLPSLARRIGLVTLTDSAARLYGLIQPALKQEAAIALVSDLAVDNLPDQVEVQPLSAISEIIEWADYVALDVARENLPGLREQIFNSGQPKAPIKAQVLVRTPLPCGGIAECGVCAVAVKSGWKMVCKDGPVFDWKELG
jgi:dihydroorotate dehydrogenase electron transfer subunit